MRGEQSTAADNTYGTIISRDNLTQFALAKYTVRRVPISSSLYCSFDELCKNEVAIFKNYLQKHGRKNLTRKHSKPLFYSIRPAPKPHETIPFKKNLMDGE